MKKFLSLLGAITITASSVSTVVACGSKDNTTKVEDNKIPETQQVKDIRQQSVEEAKGYILADAYGLNLKKTVEQAFAASSSDSPLVNGDTLSSANLKGLNINGTKGTDSQALVDLINNSNINIPIINKQFKDIIIPGVNETLGDLIAQNGSAVANITKLLQKMPITQLLSAFGAASGPLLGVIAPKIADAIKGLNLPGVIGDNLDIFLNGVASGLLTTANGFYSKYSVDASLEEIDSYLTLDPAIMNQTVNELQKSLYASIFALVGYAKFPDTYQTYGLNTLLSNKTVDLWWNLTGAGTFTMPDITIQNTLSLLMNKPENAAWNNSKAKPGLVKEKNGVLKYALQTLKILEVLIATYDSTLNDNFVINDANHLFDANQDNNSYLKNFTNKKIPYEVKAMGSNGIHLDYLLNKIGYFFSNNEENGFRILKLMNIIFWSISSNGNTNLENIYELIRSAYYSSQGFGAGAKLGWGGASLVLGGALTNVLLPILNDTKIEASSISALLSLVGTFISDEKAKKIISNIGNFINSDFAKNEFFPHPFSYLYYGDINKITVPCGDYDISWLAKALNIDEVNLHNMLNQAKINDFIKTFAKKDINLGLLNNMTIDGAITDITSQLNNDNPLTKEAQRVITITPIRNMIKLLIVDNTPFANEPDATSNGAYSKSLLYQLITGALDVTGYPKLLGYLNMKSDSDKALIPADADRGHTFVFANSFIGQLTTWLVPNLAKVNDPTANNGRGSLIDLNSAANDPSSSQDLFGAVWQVGWDLLKGANYQAMVNEFVSNNSIWTVSNVISNYDPNNKNVLLSQTYDLNLKTDSYSDSTNGIYEPGVDLNYRITIARVNVNETFSFKALTRLK